MKDKITKMQVGIWYDLLTIVRDSNVELIQIRKMADGSKEFKAIEILKHNDPIHDKSEAAKVAELISGKLLRFE